MTRLPGEPPTIKEVRAELAKLPAHLRRGLIAQAEDESEDSSLPWVPRAAIEYRAWELLQKYRQTR